MSRLLIASMVCVALFAMSVAFGGEAPAGNGPAATDKPAEDKLPEGFQRLFDGKTLKGWKGRPTLWKVEDGAIVGRTAAEAKLKHNDFLYTEKEYGDFELRLKFRLMNHNSGVQVRSVVHDDFRVTGYQADMAEKRYTGILYEEGGRGILADVDPKKTAEFVKPGQWNDYRILCQGNLVQFSINGRQTINYTEKKPDARKKGVIAFQLHGGPPMTVYFKDVILQDLSAAASRPAKAKGGD